MFFGTFTNLSIMDHYSWVEYSFNGILRLSIFTSIGTTAFFYWWEAKHQSVKNNTPPKEMPRR